MMKKRFTLLALTVIGTFGLICCKENEETDFPRVASLKVVHAASIGPAVHVNYFGTETLNFSINPSLEFGGYDRYTLPANEPRSLVFTSSEDINRQVLTQEVTLAAGEITTFYLVGDTNNLSGFLVEEVFQNYEDSIFGVSFVHAANDLGVVAAKVIRRNDDGSADTTSVVSDLVYQSASAFLQFPAVGEVADYSFQYLNSSDSVLAGFSIDPLRSRREKVFRNITLPLIGRTDDGEGNSTLKIIQIDNF